MKESHLALYRKYRPASFSDVVGQEQIVTLLQNTIKQNKIGHAYLFCGGRGTGKTTVARIFARDIGCNPEDIIEIDAASNRGIDEIRELREAVRTSPFSSPYKVYIIDEAHMLTKEAANALLKTLEEPPSHVVFILATTDPDKLPQTIVSRCQKIIFKQPDIETLSKRLMEISQKEGFKLDEEGVNLIARHGKGSYRDAISGLEQILMVSKGSVKFSEIENYIGSPEREKLLKLLENVCKKDNKEIIKEIFSLKSNNKSAIKTYDDFLELVRQGLLLRINELNDSKDEELGKLAKEYPYTISSKLILFLLEKRNLVEVSEIHGWTALEAILLASIDI